MITRKEILKFSKEYGVPATTINKDYVLGHILSGIYNNHYLKEKLIFKGGTCLRKCYFKNYRFSEDLDFTVIQKIDKKKLNFNFKKIIRNITSQTDILFGNYNITEILFRNKLMGYKFAIPFWGANHSKNIKPNLMQNLPKIKIDIISHEIIYFKVKQLKLIHPYSDILLNNNIVCYSIDEIISEKLRTILQRSYSAPRDYYDLWFLLKNYSEFNSLTIKHAFIGKCNFKNVAFHNKNDFFNKDKLISCKREWSNSLGNHLKKLPKFEVVINELKNLISDIL